MIFTIFTIALAEDDEHPLYVPGIPFNPPKPLVVAQRQNAIESADTYHCSKSHLYKQFCADDCQTRITCMGDSTPYSVVKCKSPTPYCVDDRCTDTPDPDDYECEEVLVGPQYRCSTRESYFPDPKNCSQYFYCNDMLESSAMYCPRGYVYDAKTNKCKWSTQPSDCSTIYCGNKNDEFVSYPGHPFFYGFCANSVNLNEIIMFKCDYKNFEYIDSKQKCDFQCTDDGKFLDPNDCDCDYFFECYRDFNTFKLKYDRKKCPTGLVFNKRKQQCEEEYGNCYWP